MGKEIFLESILFIDFKQDRLCAHLYEIPEGEEGDAKKETKSASELGYKGDEGVGPGLLLDGHLGRDEGECKEEVTKSGHVSQCKIHIFPVKKHSFTVMRLPLPSLFHLLQHPQTLSTL